MTTDQAVKFCDRCGQPARADDLDCLRCGYAFRVEFPDASAAGDRGSHVPPPAPPAHATTATRPPWRLQIVLTKRRIEWILLGLIVASLGGWMGFSRRSGPVEWNYAGVRYPEGAFEAPTAYMPDTCSPASAYPWPPSAEPALPGTTDRIRQEIVMCRSLNELRARLGAPAEICQTGQALVQRYNGTDGYVLARWENDKLYTRVRRLK